jgi:predicted RNase H-like nuclease (RuvC/YqgF family)
MAYSLKQAAEAVGRGKPAILRAIQKGLISAQRNAKNEWLIDPAELHRVYPPVAGNDAQGNENERHATTDATEALHRENALLREQIELLKDERQDLRRRLDDEAAERRKLTALLTHQPKPEPAPTPEPQGKGKLWEKLFGRSFS